MLHSQLINSLFKTFPFKCDDFEYILETTNNIKVTPRWFIKTKDNNRLFKELSVSFELIVNSIFGYDLTGLATLTQNDQSLLIWPLKTINRFNRTEYNSIYRFLSTDSLFWAILFKLSNLQINFKFSINYLPNYIRCRIENEVSILSQRVDTMGQLNLSNWEVVGGGLFSPN